MFNIQMNRRKNLLSTFNLEAKNFLFPSRHIGVQGIYMNRLKCNVICCCSMKLYKAGQELQLNGLDVDHCHWKEGRKFLIPIEATDAIKEALLCHVELATNSFKAFNRFWNRSEDSQFPLTVNTFLFFFLPKSNHLMFIERTEKSSHIWLFPSEIKISVKLFYISKNTFPK